MIQNNDYFKKALNRRVRRSHVPGGRRPDGGNRHGKHASLPGPPGDKSLGYSTQAPSMGLPGMWMLCVPDQYLRCGIIYLLFSMSLAKGA